MSMLQAQAQGGLEKANALFDKLSYSQAVNSYLPLAKSGNAEAIVKLANCYRLINDNKNAEEWFREAVKQSGADPINKLYYGQSLMNNEQYQEAKYWLQEFLYSNGADRRAKNLLDACNNIRNFQQNNASYEVYQLPFPVNTSSSEMGPYIYKGNLMFASDNDSLVVRNNHTWTSRTFYELYTSSMSGDIVNARYGKPAKIQSNNTNTRYHEGPISISADGGTMIFTRNNYVKGIGAGKDNEGTIRLKIYQATLRSGQQWDASNGTEMSFNSDQYSSCHPALSPDAQLLYFASDMPGGYGGMDLYVAKKSGSGYSNPVNLGPEINTEGDEVFPFVDANGTMYFASNGLPGLGGLDIYSADGENTSWSGVTNLGNPINTSKDDFGFVVDESGEWGYLSSNRNERQVGDDDIYSFKRCVITLNGIVVDRDTDEAIGGATVKLEEYGNNRGTVKTKADGKFNYNVGCEKTYLVTGSKEGYGDAVSKQVVSGSNAKIPLFVKIPIGKKSNDCVVEGIVIDKRTGEAIPYANVKITSVVDVISIQAGSDGRFSVAGEPNRTYTINASKDGYFYDQDTKNLGDCKINGSGQPIRMQLQQFGNGNPCELRLDNILYDLDKYFLRPESKLELDKVVAWMKQYPDIDIELQSHTDCRASKAYNEKLSQNRSKSCVDYIVSQGVSRSRITARGYGETQLLNGCACEPTNKSDCSESEHQLNRRTIIKIKNCN